MRGAGLRGEHDGAPLLARALRTPCRSGDGIQCGLCFAEKNGARIGERDSSSIPIEELDAETLFQLSDGP